MSGTQSERISGDHPNFANTPGRVWHRQFAELSLQGPRELQSGRYISNPTMSVFQDQWIGLEDCQTPGLFEWTKTAKPGDAFVWHNPLSAATQGGRVFVCTDLWCEDEP